MVWFLIIDFLQNICVCNYCIIDCHSIVLRHLLVILRVLCILRIRYIGDCLCKTILNGTFSITRKTDLKY